MQAAPARSYPVTILTHEGGGPPPHEQTLSQLLTDFFTSAGVGVHTLVLAGDLKRESDKRAGANAHLTLVESELYRKECVQTTRDMTNQSTQVMFLQCHGVAKNAGSRGFNAALNFACPQNEVDVVQNSTKFVFAWPKLNQMSAVSLHDVVGQCNLAIVLACNGDDVIADYVKAASRFDAFPDMLVCNAPEMSNAGGEILTVLLLNIVDSNLGTERGGYQVYTTVRAAILRIFQIVKLFGTDHDGFWGFLKQVGCVKDLCELKQGQQLPYPKRYEGADRRLFRIPVSTNTYGEINKMKDKEVNIPQHVLEQFRALELVYRRRKRDGEEEQIIEKLNWSNVPALVPADGADTCIDKYLREYVPPPAPPDSSMADPPPEFVPAPPALEEAHMRISALLARLKCV